MPLDIKNYNEFYYDYVNYAFSIIEKKNLLHKNFDQTMLDAFISGFETVTYLIPSKKTPYLKKLDEIKTKYVKTSPETLQKKAEEEQLEKQAETQRETQRTEIRDFLNKNKDYARADNIYTNEDVVLSKEIEYYVLNTDPISFTYLGQYDTTNKVISGGHGHFSTYNVYKFNNKSYKKSDLYVKKSDPPKTVGGKHKKQTKKSKKSKKSKRNTRRRK